MIVDLFELDITTLHMNYFFLNSSLKIFKWEEKIGRGTGKKGEPVPALYH